MRDCLRRNGVRPNSLEEKCLVPRAVDHSKARYPGVVWRHADLDERGVYSALKARVSRNSAKYRRFGAGLDCLAAVMFCASRGG